MFPDLLSVESLAELEADARFVRGGGRRNELAISEALQERGGNPARAFLSAGASYVQWRLFSAPALVQLIARRCGLSIEPTGGGTYTYYEQAGDFLALHRDILSCDLTVLTCLLNTGGETGGGRLLVYPQHIKEPLARTRAAGREAGIPVQLERGMSMALLGGWVPHEVTAMQSNQERVVSIMCYRILLEGGLPS